MFSRKVMRSLPGSQDHESPEEARPISMKNAMRSKCCTSLLHCEIRLLIRLEDPTILLSVSNGCVSDFRTVNKAKRSQLRAYFVEIGRAIMSYPLKTSPDTGMRSLWMLSCASEDIGLSQTKMLNFAKMKVFSGQVLTNPCKASPCNPSALSNCSLAVWRILVQAPGHQLPLSLLSTLADWEMETWIVMIYLKTGENWQRNEWGNWITSSWEMCLVSFLITPNSTTHDSTKVFFRKAPSMFIP